MKTTLMFSQMIANPRRTTLAHIKDLSELTATEAVPETTEVAEVPAEVRELPRNTANPRRTVLNHLPQAPVAP